MLTENIMQISSALMPAMGQRPMTPHQQSEPAEGTTAHAEKHIDAGATTPVEQAPESSKSDEQAADTGKAVEKGQKPEQAAKEEDPLTDSTSEEYAQVKELQARDTEVRAHEQAHLSAAGKYATGGASFSFQTGPDGQQYAIGGEVGIDTSSIPDDPEATIAKMQTLQRAATAPAEPSGQDARVAAQAAQAASAARAEIASQQFEKMQGSDESASETESEGKAESEPETKTTATGKEAQQSYHSHQQNQEPTHAFEATA